MKIPIWANVKGSLVNIIVNKTLIKVPAPSPFFFYLDHDIDLPRAKKSKETLIRLSTLKKEDFIKYLFKYSRDFFNAKNKLKRSLASYSPLNQIYTYYPDFFIEWKNEDPPTTFCLDLEIRTRKGEKFPTPEQNYITKIGAKVNSKPIRIFSANNEMEEFEMLRKFVEYYQECDPDIIIGYFIKKFDLPFLFSRLGRWNIPLSTLARFGGGVSIDQERVKINGRIIYDLYEEVFEDLSLKGIKDRSLKTVAKWFDIYHKFLDNSTLSELDTLLMTEEGNRSLENYLASDIHIVYELMNYYLPIRILLAERMKIPLSSVINCAPGFIPRLIIRRLLHKEMTVGDIVKKDIKFEGGYVSSDREGYYSPVTKVDFKSLYPSIVITFNISPKTVRVDKLSNIRDIMLDNNINTKPINARNAIDNKLSISTNRDNNINTDASTTKDNYDSISLNNNTITDPNSNNINTDPSDLSDPQGPINSIKLSYTLFTFRIAKHSNESKEESRKERERENKKEKIYKKEKIKEKEKDILPFYHRGNVLVIKTDDKYLGPITSYISMEKSSLSELMKELYIERRRLKEEYKRETDETKKKVLFAQQYVLKTITNSLYGIQGNQFMSETVIDAGVTITAIGRELIKFVKRWFKGRVLECDTDGVYIEGAVDIEEINKELETFVTSLGLENFIALDREEYKAGYFYKPKNYILLTKDDKVKIKGNALKSSRLCPYIETFIKDLVNEIMFNGLLKKSRLEIAKKLKECRRVRDVPLEDLAFQTNLTKTKEEYKGNSLQKQLYVQAEEAGQKLYRNDIVKYVPVKNGYKLLSLARREEANYSYYEDTINSILDIFNLKDIVQTRLGEFL